jgi:hypothetical protein
MKPTAVCQCWSMDFKSERFGSGVYDRVRTLINQFTCECTPLQAWEAITELKVAG